MTLGVLVFAASRLARVMSDAAPRLSKGREKMKSDVQNTHKDASELAPTSRQDTVKVVDVHAHTSLSLERPGEVSWPLMATVKDPSAEASPSH